MIQGQQSPWEDLLPISIPELPCTILPCKKTWASLHLPQYHSHQALQSSYQLLTKEKQIEVLVCNTTLYFFCKLVFFNKISQRMCFSYLVKHVLLIPHFFFWGGGWEEVWCQISVGSYIAFRVVTKFWFNCSLDLHICNKFVTLQVNCTSYMYSQVHS